jgi:hypothetical protein
VWQRKCKRERIRQNVPSCKELLKINKIYSVCFMNGGKARSWGGSVQDFYMSDCLDCSPPEILHCQTHHLKSEVKKATFALLHRYSWVSNVEILD